MQVEADGAGQPVQQPVAAADECRRDRQVQLVDHACRQRVAEQRRPALAEHVLVTQRGQPVQRERQVDVVVPAHQHHHAGGGQRLPPSAVR